MLMLSRRQGEQIRIADTIEVTVLQISGNRVQIGISAPPEVSIRRKELTSKSPLEGPLSRTQCAVAVASRAAG